jgi:hypothetical protein
MSRWKLIVAAAVAVMLVVPAAAFAATSLFEDVPDDSIFVNDINWMKTSGVTKGCNPPANTKYCPDSNVKREQMAAFMHRLAVNQVVDAGTLQGFTAAELAGGSGTSAAGAGDTFASPTSPIILSNEVITELGSMKVAVPSGDGVLSLTSQMSLENPSGAVGSFVLAWQTIDATCLSFIGATSSGISDIANSDTEIVTLTTAYAMSAGNYTIRSCAQAFEIISSDKTDVVASHLAAIWVPSSMGGATFSVSGGDDGGLTKMAANAKARASEIEAATQQAEAGSVPVVGTERGVSMSGRSIGSSCLSRNRRHLHRGCEYR